MNESRAPAPRIVVCGGGLAAHMTVAALARQLPGSIEIDWVNGADGRDADLFFGGVTAPSAYAFNLGAGVSEPRLILETDTAFSWGTQFARWGAGEHSWVQCFHLPFPIIGGVLFHHHLLRLGLAELEPFLVPAVAARLAVFAHPLQKSSRLLARAEYGYQFDPYAYCRIFAASEGAHRVRLIPAKLAEIQSQEGAITALRLADGQTLSGDLFVDCTGPDARLLAHLGVGFSGGRRLRGVMSYRPTTAVGAPCRTVTACEFGWQSETPLQRSQARLTVYSPESETQALAAHAEAPFRTGEIMLGRRENAWAGNCVAIGHAAGALEPLTHAPMLLLQRQIELLLSLIPVSRDMAVERREFNRQCLEDHLHAELFNRALFETRPMAQTPYWLAAGAERAHEKLAQKIALFESRGALAAFDLEPFNGEDWVILHFGMGRRPARYDRIADRTPESELRPQLANMQREIESLVKSMPSHREYMTNLIGYLKQKKW
jgi:tryptophan halogenase